MKKILLATASVLALNAGTASAADLGPRPVYKAPPAGCGAPPGTIIPEGVTELHFNNSHTVNGFLGGGQIGFNYQVGWWVLGAEVQGSFADLTGGGGCGFTSDLNCRSKVNGLATFAGRVGFAVDRALIYTKGGGAWSHNELSVSNSGLAVLNPGTSKTGCIGTEGQQAPCVLLQGGSVTKDQWGWTWGAGIEYAFLPNWSAEIEYDFLDIGNKTFVIDDALSFDIR